MGCSNRIKLFLFLSFLLFSVPQCTFAAEPDFGLLQLDRASESFIDPDRANWIDATPIFHDMAVEAAGKFQKKTGMPKKGIPVGGETEFWTMDIEKKQNVLVTGVLKKIGKHCYLYVEKGHELEDSTIESIVNKFDNTIYSADTLNFGSEPKPGIDGDDKVTLFLSDIKDGWEPGKGYVGGYFFPLNEYSVRDYPQSNEREMIYLDIYPSDPKAEEYLGVVAHEFQHLIHWNQDPREQKWVNEGNSQYAFHVCGYPHPGQIMSFAQAPDHNVADWKNSLPDYGAAYLFYYYMYKKFPAASGILSAAVVGNTARGIEGVDSALQMMGVAKTFAGIFDEWTVANITGNGYDETLPVKVLSRTLYPTSNSETVEDTILGWSCDYHQYLNEKFWKPAEPTIADKIEISAKNLGTVLWSLDSGVIPPKELWPPETREIPQAKALLTRIPQNSDTFTVGSFVSFPAERLNVSLYNRSMIPIEHAQIALASKRPSLVSSNGKIILSFQGKKSFTGPKEGLKLRLLFEGDKTEIREIPLDEKLAGKCEIANPESYKRVTLLVSNRTDKKFSYELNVSHEARQPELNQIISGIQRGYELTGNLKSMLPQNKEVLGELYSNTIQEYENLVELASRKIDPDQNSDTLKSLELISEKSDKAAFAPLLKLISEKASFSAQHGNAWTSEVIDSVKTLNSEAEADLNAEPVTGMQNSIQSRADDQDDSHSNIIYLCFKKGELIHALTHLKIDPKFLEGEILAMWKLLQISLNLPNIPLPDGLAIVDYKEDSAEKYIAGLLKNGATDLEKDSLRRLTIAEELTEKFYNTNLMMAEDFGYCFYEMGNLILTARSTLLTLSSGLANIPGADPVVKKVVNLIIGRAIYIVVKVTDLMAVKMKPPYNSIVPIAVHIGASVAANMLHTNIGEEYSAKKKWAAKTVAKYVFTSVPKIGYVALSQPTVDENTEYAVRNDFSGTLSDAKKSVLDDGNPDTWSSVYESFYLDLVEKHNFTMKEVQFSKIGQAVAQIAAYASVLDPTSISKVVAISAECFSGGALIHGTVSSAVKYFQAPSLLADGAVKAFHPMKTGLIPEGSYKKVSVKKRAPGSSLKGLATFHSDYEELINRIKSAYSKKDMKELAALTQILASYEEAVEAVDQWASAECESALVGTRAEQDLDQIVNDSIKAVMLRTELLGMMLSATVGALPDASLQVRADEASAAMKKNLENYRRVFATPLSEMTQKVTVLQTQTEKTDDGWRVKAVVAYIAAEPAEVAFTLYGARDTSIVKAPESQILQPWSEVEVEWLISGTSESKDMPVSISATSEGSVSAFGFAILE
ncbi:MAG: hypothetical protein HQM10_24550 [Candidatus Riflebacteria bacterium]|nr:hypothetical protein [Candidatus Riflebacteria bacterium]